MSFKQIMVSAKSFYFLFVAVLMLMAKPFVGFSIAGRNTGGPSYSIFAKAFTKRKQEYVEDSNYDSSTIQKRLANPSLKLTVLFSLLLQTLLPPVIQQGQQCTAAFLSDINLSLFPSLKRYFLSGKLTI